MKTLGILLVATLAVAAAHAKPPDGELKSLPPLDSSAQQSPKSMASSPPRDYSKPPPKCICGTTPKDVIVFKGIVEDAQVFLNADGTDVLRRQATIFRVTDPGKDKVPSPAKVWHVTNPDDCGLTFNYAKEYTVVARRVNGELETNSCLTKIPAAPAN